MQYNVQSMRDAAESVRLKLFGASGLWTCI